MAFDKDQRKFLNQMNYVMRQWNEIGVYSNEIMAIRDELWLFYDDQGKKVAHEDMFTTRMELTPDQEDRLIDIALAMANESHNFLDTYKEIQQERGFDSLTETIEFINMAEEFSQDEFYSTIFDSEQYIEVFQYAEEAGMSRNKLEAKIMKVYKKQGLTHDKLANVIFRFIDDYAKGENNSASNNW